MFLSYLPRNPVDSDKIWCILSLINLRYSSLDVFQLTWIISLHYLVKLCVAFCKWTSIGTVNPINTSNVFVTLSTKPFYKTRPILIKFCTYCPEYICHKCFPSHLNNASTLLVKLKIRFCVKIPMLKAKLENFFIDFDFTYLKRCNILTLVS